MRLLPTSAATLAAVVFSTPAAAAVFTFDTPLSPEVPGATGSGFATVVFDTGLHRLSIAANWSGLSGTTTVAHIHCCVAVPGTGTVGVAVTPGTFPGFPIGVSAGNYATVLDLTLPTTYTAGFFIAFGGGTAAGAEAALLAGMQARRAYLNIHTTTFPGGEIRGFLAPVPEPESWGLLIVGFGVLGGAMRRRRALGLRRAVA